jgi:uncharacterized protein YndB with AHSA1/START domain
MNNKSISKLVSINAKSEIVFQAFTHPNQLTAWLHAHSAVIALCKNGPYTLGWCANDDGDYYACCGRIKDFKLNKKITISNIEYYRNNKKTIGPLNLNFEFNSHKQTTTILLKQSGSGTGKRWAQNFEAVFTSWEEALYLLKKYLEKNKQAVK